MLPYLFLKKKKKITNGYLYITSKYYNTKLKKQINKKRALLHAQSMRDECNTTNNKIPGLDFIILHTKILIQILKLSKISLSFS